jgi:hypothetical protein
MMIYNIKVQISEGKLRLFPIILYCLMDFLDDGAMNISLLASQI